MKGSKESSLENLVIKEAYYEIKFDPMEFVIVLLCTVFKVVSI